MKIIHFLLGTANPNTLNGVNKVAHFLATQQTVEGVDVEVWGVSSTSQDPRHEHAYALKLFTPFGARLFPPRRFVTALDQLNSRETLFHIHSVFTPENFVVTRLLASRGIRWVNAPHGGYEANALRRGSFKKSIYFALFDKHVLRGASGVHAIGRTEVESVLRLDPAAKIVRVPNGQLALERIEVGVTVGGPRPVFGYCGRLDSFHKGLDLMLDGFAQYVQAGGRGELRLIGEGRDRRSLSERTERLGISNRVAFRGARFGDEKTAELCRFDVFLHTSRWDCVPTSVLEAGALGIPLIVSQETNVADEVASSKAGLVLDRLDAVAIGAACASMEGLHARGDLPAVGDNARKMVETEFSWRRATQQVSQLYAVATSG